MTARLYECRITHARTVPLRNVFTYRTYLWLSGPLDEHPHRQPGLGGTPSPGPRPSATRTMASGENLDHFLAGAHRPGRRPGDDAGARARARVRVQSADRLLVPPGRRRCSPAWWPRCTTPGQQHAYLLTDDRGRAQVQKEFYVSPFYPVDGRYRMSLPEPDARLALSVVLGRPDGHSFAASVRGRGVPATARALVGAAVRHPWSTAGHGLGPDPLAGNEAVPAWPAASAAARSWTTDIIRSL